MHLANHVCCAGSLHLAGFSCRRPRLPLTATCNQLLMSGRLQAPFSPTLALPAANVHSFILLVDELFAPC